MSVTLINYSKGKNDNLQKEICYIARVSNPNNQNNHSNDEKLIKYLIGHKHWSPFEMVNICLKIETTRDISRQILRHRSFSFQEFSQRYSSDISDPIIRECRLQDKKNRQSSLKNDDMKLEKEWIEKQNEIIQLSSQYYKWALFNGIAKEQARSILPEGNTHTVMYMNGTLRSWIHYIQLRSGNGTQKEHRLIAIECAKAIEPIFPFIDQFISS